MQEAIRCALVHTARLRAANTNPARTYELELRLGVRADPDGRRVKDARANATWFSSNINKSLFYATFAALCVDADDVSAPQHSTHSRFDAAPRLRQEYSAASSTTRWCDKQNVAPPQDFGLHPRYWFDVRLALASEHIVRKPDAIREARAIGARIQHRFDNERTRLSAASSMRSRVRRSLRFARYPQWRLDFTVVTMSSLIELDAGLGRLEHSYNIDGELLEIELEYLGGASPPRPPAAQRGEYVGGATDSEVERSARSAVCILELVATALGSEMPEIRRRLNSDRLEYEMARTI